jgi:hypothetical protein
MGWDAELKTMTHEPNISNEDGSLVVRGEIRIRTADDGLAVAVAAIYRKADLEIFTTLCGGWIDEQGRQRNIRDKPR